ncbi:unnamed protein product, partial [Amoebophrya sp. A120]
FNTTSNWSSTHTSIGVSAYRLPFSATGTTSSGGSTRTPDDRPHDVARDVAPIEEAETTGAETETSPRTSAQLRAEDVDACESSVLLDEQTDTTVVENQERRVTRPGYFDPRPRVQQEYDRVQQEDWGLVEDEEERDDAVPDLEHYMSISEHRRIL